MKSRVRPGQRQALADNMGVTRFVIPLVSHDNQPNLATVFACFPMQISSSVIFRVSGAGRR